MRNITNIILHHTDSTTSESAIRTLNQRGLSYHDIIDIDGNRIFFRSHDQIAHHTLGNNANSIGIALVGRFNNGMSPTNDQIRTLIEIHKNIFNNFGRINVINHRDIVNTLCPVIDLAKIVNNYFDNIFIDSDHSVGAYWSENARIWADEIKMPDGTPFFDGTRILDNVTREELITIVHRLYKILSKNKK